MLEDFKKIPNQITILRLLLLPLMWFFILRGYPLYYVGVLFIVCGITDVLDGYLARKLNQMSEFGSRLDSWGDNLLLISAIIWVAIRLPEVFTENYLLMFTAIGFYGTYLLVAAIKFHRFANLHLYLSKGATFLAYIFLVLALLMGEYSRGLFIFTASIGILANIEGIVILLIYKEVDEHIGSLVFYCMKEDGKISRWLRKIFKGK